MICSKIQQSSCRRTTLIGCTVPRSVFCYIQWFQPHFIPTGRLFIVSLSNHCNQSDTEAGRSEQETDSWKCGDRPLHLLAVCPLFYLPTGFLMSTRCPQQLHIDLVCWYQFTPQTSYIVTPWHRDTMTSWHHDIVTQILFTLPVNSMSFYLEIRRIVATDIQMN